MFTQFFGQNKKTNQIRGIGNESILSLKNVDHYYGDFQALRNINLTIKRGEMLFITGASGAGKTTLLNILAGNIKPSQGERNYAGQFGNEGPFVASVFQDLRLLENESCLTNLEISFDPSLYGSFKSFKQDKIELCRIFGIDKKLNLKVENANGGLRQKVSIIRALLSRPDIYLADEPTSALDLENARKLFDVLHLYNLKKGLTVVWSSHNKELVKKFTGRLAHLENGNLIYSGNACFM
ncbi:MAG: ABC transporter ATP-binding protein [Halobacteriovoraceae bacterium]|nr:ABC transporter ATP-binding protein [Halobacteriovoraceae bacterium]